MWCRSSDTPSIISAYEYKFSSWPTQNMNARAVGLRAKSQLQRGLARVKMKLAMFGGRFLAVFGDTYRFVWRHSLRVNCCKRARVVSGNTTMNPTNLISIKTLLIANLIIVRSARWYHDLATHFCGSIILQVFDFGLFQESWLCLASASGIGIFNLQNTEVCLLSLRWSANNCFAESGQLLRCVQSPSPKPNWTPLVYQHIYSSCSQRSNLCLQFGFYKINVHNGTKFIQLVQQWRWNLEWLSRCGD